MCQALNPRRTSQALQTRRERRPIPRRGVALRHAERAGEVLSEARGRVRAQQAHRPRNEQVRCRLAGPMSTENQTPR
eukprot:327293-Pyramimonas_sp.AAC.1